MTYFDSSPKKIDVPSRCQAMLENYERCEAEAKYEIYVHIDGYSPLDKNSAHLFVKLCDNHGSALSYEWPTHVN